MFALRSVAGLSALALGACATPAPAPRDWRDQVLYQIVTDRFWNGDPSNDAAGGVGPIPGALDRWQGGDWRGITEQLDHVARLGATAIWISPITRSVARMDEGDGYHGYWTADLLALEPHFGSEDDLATLVDEAHARGIAVLVDVVPNHLGRVFSYDLDRDGVEGDGEALPPYSATPYDAPLLFTETPRLLTPDGGELVLGPSHFHRRGVGDLSIDEERRWGDFPDGLRDLSTEDDVLADALAETYARWAIRFGLDGFRLDAVPHAELAFWQRFCGAVRARVRAAGHEHFFLLGEIFERDPLRVVPWLGPGSVDAGFDLPLTFDLLRGVVLGGAPPSDAASRLDADRTLYPAVPQPSGIGLSPWEARVLVGDSHDMPRLRALVADPFAIDQALVTIFTAGGIPLVYYGTEAELDGTGGHAGREPLWEHGLGEDTPTFALVSLLAGLRRASPALRRGTTRVLFASETGGRALDTTAPDAGLLSWERASGGDVVVVVLGTHPTRDATATLRTSLAPGTRLVDRLGGESRLVVGEGGTLVVTVGPRQSLILAPE